MAKTRSMTRNQKNHDGTSSSRKIPKSSAPWSDLDHNLLFLVMMQLRFVEFLSFRGVCKSWRSLACENQNKFMASMPPMKMSISSDANEKMCHLKNFEGRKFSTILSRFSGGVCVGLTCGYLIFFMRETGNFWLVNPITRKELCFPDFPTNYHHDSLGHKAILVFSSAISGLVFVVSCNQEIWFSIAGKGSWNHVSSTFSIFDVNAFKGKIYTVSFNMSCPDKGILVCELRLSSKPKLMLLEIKKSDFFFPDKFVSSRENIYVIGSNSDGPYRLLEIDLGEMKWLVPCQKTMEEYAFFRSEVNGDFVAIKQESWADPLSRSHGSFASSLDTNNNRKSLFFSEKMWYFPHECMDDDCIYE